MLQQTYHGKLITNYETEDYGKEREK